MQSKGAVRDYQDWLNQVSAKLATLDAGFIAEEHGFSANWLQRHEEFREIVYQDVSNQWILRLEEYEVLFPETRECRIQLLYRHRDIKQLVNNALKGILAAESEEKRKAIEGAGSKVNIIDDQVALMGDLRVHLQNTCLSNLTGNRVPERQPLDPALPKIVKDKSGKLKIAEGNDA